MPQHYGDKKMNGKMNGKKAKPKAKGLTEKQKKNLPPALQKAIMAKRKM
jgi:hypothetical protein